MRNAAALEVGIGPGRRGHRSPAPGPFLALAVVAGVLLCGAVAEVSAAVPARRPRMLRLARMMDPATLDPILAMPVEDVTLVYLLYQPLVDLRDGANLFGNGASAWTMSPDARTFTFTLRPEARFSNGRPVVAADYAFTLERAAVPNAERFRLYREAERIVVADAPWLFLGYRNLFLLRQPWIRGPVLEPFGCYRLDRAWMEP